MGFSIRDDFYMKYKIFILSTIVVLSCCCLSCSTSYSEPPKPATIATTATATTTTTVITTATATARVINEEQAIEIVRKKVSNYVDGSIFEINGTQTDEKNNAKYFVVHVYSLGSTMQGLDTSGNPTGTYQQTFTYGWFYVDIANGDVYVEDTYKDEDGNLKLYLKPF